MSVRHLALAALLALAAAATASAQAAQDPEAGAVRAAVRELADAMHARDRARLEARLAPAFVLRASPDIDRETWIGNAVTLCWGDRSDIDAFEARRHGDTMIATFLLTFYVDPGTCAPAVLRSLITDVWTRDAGGWRLAVRHAGPPPDAGVAAQFGVVPAPPPRWEATGELSFLGTAGNTSTRTLGAGGAVLHRRQAGTTRASFAFLTSESDAVTQARAISAQARHGFRVADRVEVFGDAAYRRDRFAGIDDRVTTAAGATVTATPAPGHVIRTEGSLGFTAEQRLDASRLRFATAIGAVHYKWTPAQGTSVTQEASVTADLGTPENWRGTSVTALGVTLTRLLSLKISHAVEYRNQPVAAFKRTDMRTAAAVVVSLER